MFVSNMKHGEYSDNRVETTRVATLFFSPGATTPIGDCILQPSSGL